MKTSYILMIACISLLSISQACNKDEDAKKTTGIPCLPANISPNVVAFYPFDHGSLKDASGNGIDLSNNTTAKPAPDRNGNPGCAFEFDNFPQKADSLFTTNTQKLNALPAFSISLWYQPLDTLVQQFPAKTEYMLRYSTWKVALFDCRKAIFELWDGNSMGYSIWDKDIVPSGAADGCQQEQKLRTGIWHHLVVSFDKVNNVAKLYRNNILQEADSSVPFSTFAAPANITSLLVGSSFTGRIDDIIIFDKALTAGEVTSLFQTEPCCSGK